MIYIPKKVSYAEIKSYIEIESKSGCILLSTEYNHSKEKLKVQCPCGNIFKVSFSNFKYAKQRRCKTCNGYEDWNINQIKEFLESLGYHLLSKEYIYKHIEFVDNYGFLYVSNFYDLLYLKQPSKFHIQNPYTIHNIKLWCKLNNKPFELISDKYEGSHKKLKWKCLKENCGEVFEMTWCNIISRQGCPFCRGLQVGLSNCLAIKNPKLAKEWHSSKNGTLTPYEVTCNTNKKVWWQCSKNPHHEWKAGIFWRNRGQGCPYCSGRYASDDYNLFINNPELALEWNYNKNKDSPLNYTIKSGAKVWWQCKECGFEWKATIYNRSNGSGCPKCNKSKGERKIIEILNSKNIYYIYQKIFNGLVGINGGNLSYDFYLPNHNILIEFQGVFHDGSGCEYTRQNLDVQQEHDRRKRKYAKNHNIKLLEIWYYDFDKIEEILDKELSNKYN